MPPDKKRSTAGSFAPHSVLVVSASETFNAEIRRILNGKALLDFEKNAQAARRCILERYYDLIIVNVPLPGEPGDRLAMDAADELRASVLLVIPAEVYDFALNEVTDHGILALSKPLVSGRLDKAVRYLFAVQDRLHELESRIQAERDKAEELRTIDKAKFALMEKERMTEDEAHRFIGKQAMDRGVSRKRIAEQILDRYD